jgi:hypothetical protein
MAYPTLAVNGTTGSDTAASGAGPATAVTGTQATVTNGSGSVAIADAVSLAGVATDGSACLFVNTASGRAYSKITAVAGSSGAWTVTVEDTVWTAGSGLAWAIGGARATLDNANTRRAMVDWKAGWSIDVQSNQTLTAAVPIKAGAYAFATPPLLFSSSASRPLITTATNSINLFDTTGADYLAIRHLAFSNTAAVPGAYASGVGHAFCSRSGGANGLAVSDCVFDRFSTALDYDNVVNFGGNVFLERVEVKNCVSQGLTLAGQCVMDRCYIHDNGADGVKFAGAPNPLVVTNSVFAGNAGRGLYFGNSGTNSNQYRHLVNSTFRGNANAGVEFADNGYRLFCHDNVFSGNGDYGVKLAAAQATASAVGQLSKNAFYNNTNGAYLNCPPSPGDVTLTADPFTSAADFGLNAAGGGGAACKGVAGQAPNVSVNPPGDLGAVPSGGGAAAPGGGGGGAAQRYGTSRRS